MTRKRFIKLLMAKGFSRNQSNTIATQARKETSYAEAMLKASVTISCCTKLIAAAIDVMRISISEVSAALIRTLE